MKLFESPPNFKSSTETDSDFLDLESDFRRRWPPEQFPALYLPENEFHALRRRERRRQKLLELLGPHIADIAAAVVEDCTDEQRI
jgi:hypothetical protein